MELDKLKLAEDSDTFLIETRQENHDVLLNMLQQAHSSLEMFSYNLDGLLYDTSEFNDALRTLSTRHKQVNIRILLRDINHLVTHGHRIMELARRLPSYIEIRQVNHNYEHIISAYSIVDQRGMIFRNDALRYEAKVSFNEPKYCHELLNQFNEIWQHSVPSQEVRRLHI